MTWIFQHHVNYIANCSMSPGGGDSKTREVRVQGFLIHYNVDIWQIGGVD